MDRARVVEVTESRCFGHTGESATTTATASIIVTRLAPIVFFSCFYSVPWL